MKIQKPENLTFLLLTIFGVLMVLITPLGAGTDEETHIGRIWEMSSGELIPNKILTSGPNYPCVFFETSYYNDPFFTTISWTDWNDLLKIKINWDSFCNVPTRARYFPTMYLVQAFIMGVFGRVFESPIAVIYFLIRFSYVLIYALLGFFVVKITPFGKWVFGVLLILPMSLIQASTINPDSINNGISFAFIAWVLYLAFSKKTNFSKREWLISSILVALVCTIKPNSLPLLILLFLVPKEKLGTKKWFIGFLIVLVLSILVIGVGWNILTSSFLLNEDTNETLSVVQQFKNIFFDPLHFIKTIFNFFGFQFGVILRDWIGASGYYFWNLPVPLYIVYPVTLLLSLFTEQNEPALTSKQRHIIFAIFLICFISTIMVFYLLYNNPKEFIIPGIYGRYFIFVMPLLFILFASHNKNASMLQKLIKIGLILSCSILLISSFLIYHVDCGNTYFESQNCTLPRYRNWSPETSQKYGIKKQETISQSFSSGVSGADFGDDDDEFDSAICVNWLPSNSI